MNVQYQKERMISEDALKEIIAKLKPAAPPMQYKTARQTILALLKAGIAKGLLTWYQCFTLGIYSGIYVGFGALLMSVVAGGMSQTSGGVAVATPIAVVKMAGGIVFPIALMLVIMAGSELFTSNTMTVMMGWAAGKVTGKNAAKNLFWVYMGNFAGCVLVAYFLATLTDILTADPWATFLYNTFNAKVNPNPGKLFLKGIGCNTLVCLAVWCAVAAEDIPGKLMGCWPPIFMFAVIGFEHSIANQFFLPCALMVAATNGYTLPWTFCEMLGRNLIPVTLGNIVGGTFVVGAFHYWAFAPAKALEEEEKAAAAAAEEAAKSASRSPTPTTLKGTPPSQTKQLHGAGQVHELAYLNESELVNRNSLSSDGPIEDRGATVVHIHQSIA